jgi:branched-chain amino acid aminotransferase
MNKNSTTPVLQHLRTSISTESRLASVDFDTLGFGAVFSDHMFNLHYEDGRWQRPEILPYGPMTLEPGNATLHYGQAVFEGLKAFKGADGQVRVFRPDMNARRLSASCERLCIPAPAEGYLLEAIDELIRLDHGWIPRQRGEALYIRPLIFSTENHLEVRASRTFRLVIMTSPVRAYFDKGMQGVALKVEEDFTRAAPGGTGAAKTAGNYAGSLYPTARGVDEGYAQVLWLDSIEHRYVEEVGAMNIFFVIGDKLVTPGLRGTILSGVTRDSAITLLEAAGHVIEQRRISIDEVVQSITDGSMKEAFGAGTAAIIAPVGKLNYRATDYLVNNNEAGHITRWLYDQLTGIQLGEVEDRHGWNRIVRI